MLQILVAGVLFVVTHLGIGSTSLRGKLTGALGERGYLGVYSLVALGTLVYLIWLYGQLPRYDYVWMPSPALYGAAKVIMPFALMLMLGGFMVKNPTNVGMEDLLKSSADDLVRGMMRITRHPFQWGVVLWSVAHLLANGDTISIVFFGSFATLSGLGGMLIDRKKAASLGDDWTAFANQTSNLPFAAILSGRNKLVLGELWLPIVVGLVAYGLIAWGHEWVSGVRIL